MSSWGEIELPEITSEKGTLKVIESGQSIPFHFKRVFWISGVPHGAERGFHAHKTGHQLLVCLSGEILAKLDDGRNEVHIRLRQGGPGVWVRNMVWGEQLFIEPNSILLVVASNEYDESDYIRNRKEFETLVQKTQ